MVCVCVCVCVLKGTVQHGAEHPHPCSSEPPGGKGACPWLSASSFWLAPDPPPVLVLLQAQQRMQGYHMPGVAGTGAVAMPGLAVNPALAAANPALAAQMAAQAQGGQVQKANSGQLQLAGSVAMPIVSAPAAALQLQGLQGKYCVMVWEGGEFKCDVNVVLRVR